MRILGATFRTNRLVILAALVGLVVVSASPAGAADSFTGSGSGSGSGWEYAGTNISPCGNGSNVEGFLIAGDTFIFTQASTYTYNGPSGSTTAYAGNTQTTITVGQHVVAPQGVAPSCPSPGHSLVPSPVTITGVTISGTTGNLSITCNNVATGGTYTRSNHNVEFKFVVPCTITQGNATKVNADPTSHDETGTLFPCTDYTTSPPTPNPACSADTTGASGVLTTMSFTASAPA